MLREAPPLSSAVAAAHCWLPLCGTVPAMSVNVTLGLAVTGLGDEATVAVARAALERVFVAESVDRDVVLVSGSDVIDGHTPYPLIISRFYAWHEPFEDKVRAAVAAVAPHATVALDWGFPDEE